MNSRHEYPLPQPAVLTLTKEFGEDDEYSRSNVHGDLYSSSSSTSSSLSRPISTPSSLVMGSKDSILYSSVSSASIISSLSCKEDNEQTRRPLRSTLRSNLRSQNHFAAVSLQRILRGFLTRRKLWSRDGILAHWAATKIQKTFRMYVGIKKAFERAKQMQYTYAARIQNLNKIFKARQQLRVLRAEKTLSRLIMLQRKFRDRKERKLWRVFMLKVRDTKCRTIQRVLRGHNGRRRFRAISERLNQKFMDITKAIKADTTLSQNFTLKVTGDMIDVGHCTDEWLLLDYVLNQFLGTNRQIAYLNIATDLNRRYPNFFFGRYFLCVILLSVWTSKGPQRLIVEDMLSEALELLNYLMGEASAKVSVKREDEANLVRDGELLPPSLRKVDVYSTYEGRFMDETTNERCLYEEILEEFELSYFRCAFKRHGYTDVTCSQMAIFLIVRSQVTPFYDLRTTYLRRAKNLLRKARHKAHAKAAEEMHLRINLFNDYFEQERSLILRRKRFFKDCVMADWVRGKPAKIYRRGGRDDRPKLNVELDFFYHGEMLVVEGKVVSSTSNRSMSTTRQRSTEARIVQDPNSAFVKPTEEVESNHWNEQILIRPLVLLSRDVKVLTDHSVIYVANLLKQSKDDVSRRGKWNILAEYLFHDVRIVSCTSRFSKGKEIGDGAINKRGNNYSRARISLPLLDYRKRERNSQVFEEYGIRLLQRTYRGFRGRALWRRLCQRKLARLHQNEVTRKKRQALADIRRTRYLHASHIQAMVRGYLWRKMLKLMQRSALTCQRTYRGYTGRKRVKALIRRRMLGAPVYEMIRRGVVLDGLRITLVIHRCGLNYKLLGQDLINNCEYHGNVWQEEVDAFLEEYNKQFTGNMLADRQKRVMSWQHPRVVELIAEHLSLVTKITTVTTQFGAVSKRSEKQLVFMDEATGRGIEQRRGLNRGLKDTAVPVMRKLKRIEDREQRKREEAELLLRKQRHHQA